MAQQVALKRQQAHEDARAMNLQEVLTGKPLPDSYLPPGPIFGMVVTEPKPKRPPQSDPSTSTSSAEVLEQNLRDHKKARQVPGGMQKDSASTTKSEPGPLTREDLDMRSVGAGSLSLSPEPSSVEPSPQAQLGKQKKKCPSTPVQITDSPRSSPTTSQINLDEEKLTVGSYMGQHSLAQHQQHYYPNPFLAQNASINYPVVTDAHHLVTASQIFASQLAAQMALKQQSKTFFLHNMQPTPTNFSHTTSNHYNHIQERQDQQQQSQSRTFEKSNDLVWRPFL